MEWMFPFYLCLRPIVIVTTLWNTGETVDIDIYFMFYHWSQWKASLLFLHFKDKTFCYVLPA